MSENKKSPPLICRYKSLTSCVVTLGFLQIFLMSLITVIYIFHNDQNNFHLNALKVNTQSLGLKQKVTKK